ncbi:MAG: MarR family winged helix-turn-helix transcriptional regulator [Anaerovoracaceae bacterium]|jgi:DNA-binding MarR family transcriptional regulator
MENTELMFLLSRTVRTLHGKPGRRPAQERVLHILKHHGSCSQKEIMEKLHLSQGTVSEMIIKLENRGLVEKKRDPEDGRRYLLSLTEKGAEQESRLHERNVNEDAAALECLTNSEKERLAKLLMKILRSRGETV